MDARELSKYKRVQNISRDTLEYLTATIRKGMTEKDLCDLAKDYMKDRGISSFWYHGLPALVLIGERTTVSDSGKNYTPSKTIKVGESDLITIDLHPELNGYWGDFARSIVIINGKPFPDKFEIPNKHKELYGGILIENRLHISLKEIVVPEMTFEEIYIEMSHLINSMGYVNLDFKGNLGHSIENDKRLRRYIKHGEKTRISDVTLFTFEPHIRRTNGYFGYKMEDTYYFKDGSLKLI